MPMSQSYKDRLFPILPQLAAHYGTPFHIYDEAGIRATGAGLNQAFAGIPGFREYFAVKALPVAKGVSIALLFAVVDTENNSMLTPLTFAFLRFLVTVQLRRIS